MNEIYNKQSEILNELRGISIPGFEGYKIDQLLFSTVCAVTNSNHKEIAKEVLKKIYFNFFINQSSRIFDNKLLLISYDYQRTDHRNSWNVLKSYFNEFDEIKITASSLNGNGFIGLNNIARSVSKYHKFLNIFKTSTTFEKDICKYLAANLVELYRLGMYLDSLKLHEMVMIQYFDGNAYENLIAQYCKSHGMKTITMQHGQPVFHGKNTDRLNQTMILNFSSDFVAVPGGFSKKQFMAGGINEDHIKVVGHLNPVHEYRQRKTGKFAVLLDCPTFDFAPSANRELLESAEALAQSLDLTYVIKLHPQDEKNQHDISQYPHATLCAPGLSVREALNDSEFALLHYSGVFVDALGLGMKSYSLNKYIDQLMPENDLDLFSTVDDLIRKGNKWIKMSFEDRKAYIKELQHYYLGPDNAKENYQNLVAEIESEQ